jgi:hypothetical protein
MKFNRDSFALDEAGFAQPHAECAHTVGEPFKRFIVEKGNYRHRALLSTADQRPRGSHTNPRDEFAASHDGTPTVA